MSDIKEARVDEALESMTDVSILHVVDEAMDLQEMLDDAAIVRDQACKELLLKSQSTEDAVTELIDKFVAPLDLPENKYQWLEQDKVFKVLASQTRLNEDYG